MNSTWLQLAAAVVTKSGPERPADGVLRETLRAQSGLARATGREVSRAVFAYYRWRGWIKSSTPNTESIAQALELAARFGADPGSFSANELAECAVAPWVRDAMDVSEEWLRTLQTEPLIWLRARRGTSRDLATRLGRCKLVESPGFEDALIYEGDEDLFRRPEFHAGEFELQDASSQQVGWLCGPTPGETWWDACAGEGGKLLHLSSLMANKGLIWASDRADWRLKRLKVRTARAGCFNYRAVPWDGGAKLPTKTKFDGVLVDAPCSGVGTWQRNPHARWTTTPVDVRELAEAQGKLLDHVAPAVKPGGRLIYAVCTLTRAETFNVAERFAAAHGEFEPSPLPGPAGRSSAPEANTRWMWPQDLGGNGMFVAAWRRRKDDGRTTH